MKRNIYRSLYSFLIIFLFSINGYVQTKEKDELEEKRSKIEKEIAFTNKLLEEIKDKEKNTLNELQLLKSNIEKRNLLINELSNEINEIELEIKKSIKTINSLTKDLEKVRNEYSALIYYAFKNNNSQINLMYLLASESVNQFYSRYKYLQQYKEYRIKQIKLIVALSKIIEKKIEELKNIREEKIIIINKKLSERNLLLHERGETSKIINDLKKKESNLLDELKRKKLVSKRLEKEIEELIIREAKRNRFESLTINEKAISLDFEKNKGKLPWPTQQGVITGKFGEHADPVIKDIIIRNNGIDITTLKESKVRAVFNGIISKVFTIKGANSTVIIQHGNFFTVYHNIINVCVKVGEKVSMKDPIGDVYTDNKKGVSILHFELYKEFVKQNPELWLSN